MTLVRSTLADSFPLFVLIIGHDEWSSIQFGNIMLGSSFRNNIDVVVLLVKTPCSLIYTYQKFQCYILLLSVRSRKNIILANASNLWPFV